MVTRVTEMAAKHGGYQSAVALQASTRTVQGQPTPITTGDVSRATYNSVTEYAAALEAKNLEIENGQEGQKLDCQQPPQHIGVRNRRQHHHHRAGCGDEEGAEDAGDGARHPDCPAHGAGEGSSDCPRACARSRSRDTSHHESSRHALCTPQSPKGAKTSGVDKNGRTIQYCASCTKHWVTHADNDCL